MPSLGRLFAELGLDNTELERKGKQSDSTLKGIDARMRDVVNQAGKVAIGLGAVGSAIAVNLVNRGGEAARQLRAMADLAGTTAGELQRHAFASERVGIEQDKLADIYKDARDRIGDFLTTGAGPLADFFEQIAPQIGVTADEFRGLSGPEVLQKLVNELERAGVSANEMVFHMEAMAGDASRLIPLFRDNGAELGRLGDQAETFGTVISDIELDRLEDAKDSLDNVQASMERASTFAAATMAPAIQAIADVLSENLAKELQNSEDDVISWGDVVANILAFTADAATSAINVLSGGFQAAGQTIGAGFAEGVARIKGDTEEADAIAQEWRDNMLSIGEALANADSYTAFRDRLAEIRREAERVRGIEEIEITRGRRTPNLKQREELEAAEEAAEKQAEVEAQRAAEAEQRQRELLESRLDMLRESVLNERELEQQRHEESLALLDEAYKHRQIKDSEYLGLREELEAEHIARLNAIREQGLTALEKFTQASFREQAETVASELANMTAGVARESRAMFEINKVAGIANAIINTSEAITKALSAYPPPLSFAMAAAQGAAGVAQINAIRSQSFGGGGAAPSLAGSTPAPPVSPVSGGAPESGPERILAIEGISEDQLFSGVGVRALLERVQDAVDDGFTLKVTG